MFALHQDCYDRGQHWTSENIETYREIKTALDAESIHRTSLLSEEKRKALKTQILQLQKQMAPEMGNKPQAEQSKPLLSQVPPNRDKFTFFEKGGMGVTGVGFGMVFTGIVLLILGIGAPAGAILLALGVAWVIAGPVIANLEKTQAPSFKA